MKKILKYCLIGTAGLIALLAIAVVGLVLTFNPNDHKPFIVKLVKEKKQRTLNIEGDIRLAFWPKLGVSLGKTSLSEHKSDKEFASIESARVFVALLPLLRRQLVIDTVYVDGIKANIVRFKDGSTNFDDLLSEEEDSEEIRVDIDGISVTHATVMFTDEASGRRFNVSDAEITTGHLAKNQPIDLETRFRVRGNQPEMDVKLEFTGTLLADTERKQFAATSTKLSVRGDVAELRSLDLKLSGDLEARPETLEFMLDGLKLAAKANLQGKALAVDLQAPRLAAKKDEVSGKEARLSLSQTQGSDSLAVKLVIADLKGSSKAFQSSAISGEISGKQGARSFSGKFSSPFNGSLENLVFDLPKLAGEVDVKDTALPKGAMKAGFNLNAHADIKHEEAKLTLDASVDGSRLTGNIAVAGFAKPSIKFNLNADQIDLNKMLGKPEPAKAKTASPTKPADLSALKNVLAEGKLGIGAIRYDNYRISNLAMTIKADGQSLSLNPLTLKFDDSQIKGSAGIRHFERPLYVFDLNIDRLDADRYITKTAAPAKSTPSPAVDTPLDLSALKAFNAQGTLRIGSLKVSNIRSTNVRLDVKADNGQVGLNPFSANLYDGSMAGSLNVDARAMPAIALRQDMKGIRIGPLLVDAINNDLLDGKGSLNLDIKTQGTTVGALKKALNGKAAVALTDGAIKGIDIAGMVRDLKNKLDFKGNTLGADPKKKTDFSEMTASFNIHNGVAHNSDLMMKAPLLRVTGSGDIDIGNETLNYTARPTVVSSLKGQGGADLQSLDGLTFPVQVTGAFSAPKFHLDFAAIAAAIAQKNLLGKAAGVKGEAVQKILGGDVAGGLQGLAGGSKKSDPAAPSKKSSQDSPQKKLNKLLGF
jgi:AsmA protein